MSTRMKFPREKPRPDDFNLWNSAIQTLSSASYAFPYRLVSFLNHGAFDRDWFISENGKCLYVVHSVNLTKAFDVYTLEETQYSRRQGEIFEWKWSEYGTPP